MRSSLGVGLIALVLGMSARVSAQEVDAGAPAEAPAPAAAATPTPSEAAEDDDGDSDEVEAAREVLRAGHIGELAARTRVALQNARPLIRSSGDLQRVERALGPTEESIRRLSHPQRLERIPELSQRELADLRADWRRHGRVLEDWLSQLTERSQALEAARSELVELRRTWSTLRDASEVAGHTEPRHTRIVTAHDEARDGAASLDEERERVLALIDRVTELLVLTEDVAEQLRNATAAYRERLWIRDAPPLTSGALRQDEARTSMAAEAEHGLRARTETPRELLEELRTGSLWLAAMYALLVLGIFVRTRGAEPSKDERVRAVLAQPFTVAAFLVFLLAQMFLEHPPILVLDVLFFATLWPLDRLARVLVRPSLLRILHGTMIALAVHRVESMLPEGSAVLRIVLLLESLTIAIVSGLALRRARIPEHAVPRSVELALATTLAIGTVSIVANVSGYVFLATIVVRGSASSIYAGLSIALGVALVDALWSAIITSRAMQTLAIFRDRGPLVRAQTMKLVTLAAVLAWGEATLDGFGAWGPLSGSAEDLLRERHTIGTLQISIGAVLGAIGILIGTSFVLRFVRFVLELDVLPRLGLEPGVDGAISGLTRYVLGGSGLLLALAFLGIDTSQIALVAGALGVGIGFGLQGIVANFIAGIVLMLERPVRLGDFIEVGLLVGSVDRIGLRSSTVRGLDGAEVIVPNESLISREVVNWTLSDRRRRVEIRVGVAYGTDPHDVLTLLRGVVEAHGDLATGAAPTVVFEGFGGSSLDFALQFWTASFADSIRLKSEIGIAVHDALAKAGIIALPKTETAPTET